MRKYIPLIAEAILPLVGYFYWNWSWYFILLFYIFDAFAKEILLHVKSKKILATQGGKEAEKKWIKSGVYSALFSIALFFLLHFMYFINHPSVNFGQEFIAFLSYTEMGVQQGWVLLPLIVLNVWMQYKYTFIKFGFQFKTRISMLWDEHLKLRYFYFFTVVIGLGLHAIFQFNDWVFVWVAVSLPFLFISVFRKNEYLA